MADDVMSPDSVLAATVKLDRFSERLAALEARTGAEIAALKRDTEVIRTGIHETNNKITETFAMLRTEQVILRDHVEVCNRRGARAEKVAWLMVMLLLGTIGFLLKVHFFPGLG